MLKKLIIAAAVLKGLSNLRLAIGNTIATYSSDTKVRAKWNEAVDARFQYEQFKLDRRRESLRVSEEPSHEDLVKQMQWAAVFSYLKNKTE